MTYVIRYEIEVQPTPVIVELRFKDLQKAKEVFEDRRYNFNCKRCTFTEISD